VFYLKTLSVANVIQLLQYEYGALVAGQWQIKWEALGKICPSANFLTNFLHVPDRYQTRVLRGEKLSTNILSHSMSPHFQRS
jgi:hypothetical protein